MARRHMEQVWPGDSSSTNTKSWPPILGSSSSIIGSQRLNTEIESESAYQRLFKFKRLGYLGFNSGIGFLCSSCQSLRSDNPDMLTLRIIEYSCFGIQPIAVK